MCLDNDQLCEASVHEEAAREIQQDLRAEFNK